MVASAQLGAYLKRGDYWSLRMAKRLLDDAAPDCGLLYEGVIPLHALAKSTNSAFDWNRLDGGQYCDNASMDLYEKIVAGGPRSAINARTSDAFGLTTLQLAIGCSNDIADRLITELDIRIDAPSMPRRLTALMIAARRGNVDLTKKLMKIGANPNAATIDGRTPLMFAAEFRFYQNGCITFNDEIIRLLIRADANVNASSTDGETALMMAAIINGLGIVRQLLDRGADPNAQNNDGQTALMLAASKGASSVVDFLVQQSATVDIYIVDRQNRTAFDHATSEINRATLTGAAAWTDMRLAELPFVIHEAAVDLPADIAAIVVEYLRSGKPFGAAANLLKSFS